MKAKPGRLLLLALVAVAVVLVIYALRPRPVAVDLVEVSRGPLRVTLDEEGETRVRNRYVVSAPVSGTLERVDLEPGDLVFAKETFVARFRPAPLDPRLRAEAQARVQASQAAVERATAERERARAAAELAESEAERYRQMFERGVATGRQREAAEAEAAQAKEALAAAEQALQIARYELEAARAALLEGDVDGVSEGNELALRSPIDGVVLEVFQKSRSVLPAGEPILSLADLSELEIVVDYLSSDAVRIEPGQPVVIEDWGGNLALPGRVRRVEPSAFTKISALGVEEQRVNVLVDFEAPEEAWKELGDGYRVEASIVVWETDDALRVPTSALFRRGDDWSVFVVEEGVARLRSVSIGRRNDETAEVLAGLEAGERVIPYPSDAVEDGVRVQPR